jgi:hypothetical protein
MRCLYCNKELALLKRLTGGAEFCSDAHRKKYQEEFNDLALTRLMQAPPAPPAKPLSEPEPLVEPKPEPIPEPVRAPRSRPQASAGPKLVPQVPTPSVDRPTRAERKPAQPKDPAAADYLIEQPVYGTLDFAVPPAEPPIWGSTPPTLPSHAFEAAASERGFSRANPVALNLSIERHATPIRPRDGNLEIREFSRQALTPAQPSQQILTNDSALSSAFGEAMEITNQPRPPADPPMIWQAGPHPAPTIDPVLGDLARLDYTVTGFGEDSPAEQPQRLSPAVPTVDPVAAPPSVRNTPSAEILPAAMQPLVAAQPPAAVVPEPATQALPVTLHGVGAGPAQPTAIITASIAALIEPQVPASAALPLRPTMVLAPRPTPTPAPAQAAPRPTPATPPQPKAPEPKPVAAASAPPAPAPKPVPVAAPPAPVANTSAVRPVRGTNGKNRRPEVRVVQAGVSQAQAAQVPSQQPAAVAPPPKAPAPVQTRSVAPEPPKEASRTEPAKVAPKLEPVKLAPKPEVDLNLPVLHNPEVVGPWGRLPGAAKAGIGAVLALGIVGLAYTVFNGSNAAATTVAREIPTYQLGKQINSGGWIEDWAPADTLRRVTLLRGSQPYSDYRIEFQAQIQNKAIGWMYRGLNPKSFYVVKLEKLKAGLEPVVALVRYAVIDGENEKRVEKVLPMKVRVDTTYKIRFDAVGSEFAVWVQDQKIDEWRDSRLGSGGLGLYSEGEEAAAINGTVNVFELISTK